MRPEIRKSRCRPQVSNAEKDDCQPAHNEHDNHRDLDQCKPELHLAERAHSQHIRAVQHNQRSQYRYPLWKVGKPVASIHANGRKFGHAGHDPHEPVGPARSEASERTDEPSSGRESPPSALTEPDVKLAPHPAPTLQPPVARQAATGRTDWGPVARCIPANASMLVPGV